VSALEKSTGRDVHLTVKSNKGRMPSEEVERLVLEAERYKAEDEANKARVVAESS
jgi:heat shock protein 1/8